ncbi:hypothetical protein [Pyrodictium abyssi]|uniref:Uncharacterized protein n=1 Tax=Pyrodictium abyssi TaxID=54256 RepID=A0ABM8ITT1_9CREN|nr:hypothetical protein PABY_05380 [Pyrodictium abyssi]
MLAWILAALAAGTLLGLALARRGLYSRVGRAVDAALAAMVYAIVLLVGLEAGASLRGSSGEALARIAASSIVLAAATAVASLAAAIVVLRLAGRRPQASLPP